MRVRLTPNARTDLREIHDWIARDDPDAAVRFAAELRRKAGEVGELPFGFPACGGRRAELRKRSWRDYIIVYRVTREVEIVGFFHARRDYLKLLDDI